MLFLPLKYLLFSICTCCISLFMSSPFSKSLTPVRLPLRIFILRASAVYQVLISLFPYIHCQQRPHIITPYRSTYRPDANLDFMHGSTSTPAASLGLFASTVLVHLLHIYRLPWICSTHVAFFFTSMH
jgi:hypothetical protein